MRETVERTLARFCAQRSDKAILVTHDGVVDCARSDCTQHHATTVVSRVVESPLGRTLLMVECDSAV